MLFTEPIVAWFAIYDGLNYAYVIFMAFVFVCLSVLQNHLFGH